MVEDVSRVALFLLGNADNNSNILQVHTQNCLVSFGAFFPDCVCFCYVKFLFLERPAVDRYTYATKQLLQDPRNIRLYCPPPPSPPPPSTLDLVKIRSCIWFISLSTIHGIFHMEFVVMVLVDKHDCGCFRLTLLRC